MLARIVNMRGVNLNVFQFDYDLTWAAFFLNGEEHIYARFGGRDAGSADKYLTLAGLKHAMKAALDAHRAGSFRREPQASKLAREMRTVEQYPAAKRLKEGACIHCHQIWDFRREALKSEKKWTRDDIWVYPLPENIGLSLAPEEQTKVIAVRPNSPAEKAGLKPGDVLLRVAGRHVHSFADVQHALHESNGEQTGLAWHRGEQVDVARIDLPSRWRETDISWRESMWGLEPPASMHGQDLSAEEKKSLGLGPKRLAFRQGKFIPVAARNAGVREGDIILGFDDKELEMTMLQFNAWVRLNHQVGDQVRINLLRDGKALSLTMTLPARASF